MEASPHKEQKKSREASSLGTWKHGQQLQFRNQYREYSDMP
jgi:hypothetical protein